MSLDSSRCELDPHGATDFNNRIAAPASGLSQPIPMDMNGDLKIDLFGIPSSESSSSPFKVWRNVWNESTTDSNLFSMYVPIHNYRVCVDTQTPDILHSGDPKFKGTQCTLANPHSNAAVDLNGDCLAGEYRVGY